MSAKKQSKYDGDKREGDVFPDVELAEQGLAEEEVTGGRLLEAQHAFARRFCPHNRAAHIVLTVRQQRLQRVVSAKQPQQQNRYEQDS